MKAVASAPKGGLRVMPLAEAAAAQKHLADRQSFGKIGLNP
jgi:hypothetical protein